MNTIVKLIISLALSIMGHEEPPISDISENEMIQEIKEVANKHGYFITTQELQSILKNEQNVPQIKSQ